MSERRIPELINRRRNKRNSEKRIGIYHMQLMIAAGHQVDGGNWKLKLGAGG